MNRPVGIRDDTELTGITRRLTGAQMRILAALSLRPQGLLGTASVALAAGVPRNDVDNALERLTESGLVSRDMIPDRGDPRPRSVAGWRLLISEAWFEVAEEVRTVSLPQPAPSQVPQGLPERFRHLFWWGDPGAIELPRDAEFVAEHILSCHDIEAWGWAITTLPPESLERVAAAESTSPPMKAMIGNALAQRNGLPV